MINFRKKIKWIVAPILALACLVLSSPQNFSPDKISALFGTSTDEASMTFDGTTTDYATLADAWDAATACDTTDSKRATVQLKKSVEISTSLANTNDYISLNLFTYGLTFTGDNTGISSAGGCFDVYPSGETIWSSASTCASLVTVTGGTCNIEGVLFGGTNVASVLSASGDETKVEVNGLKYSGSGLVSTINADASATVTINAEYDDTVVTCGSSYAIKRTDKALVKFNPSSGHTISITGASGAVPLYSDGSDGTCFYVDGDGGVSITGPNGGTITNVIHSSVENSFVLNKGTLTVDYQYPTISDGTFSNSPCCPYNSTMTVTAGANSTSAVEITTPTLSTYKENKYIKMVALKITYGITYYDQGDTDGIDYSGESGEVKSSYIYGDGYSIPNPSKDDYAFDGWYTTYNGDELADIDITTSDSGTKTYYARWVTPEAEVTFDIDHSGAFWGNYEKYLIGSIDKAWSKVIGYSTTSEFPATITLKKDVTVSSHLENTDDYIVIDTNGFTLSFTGTGYITSNGGSLSVKGKGTIRSQISAESKGATISILGGSASFEEVTIENYATSGDYPRALYVEGTSADIKGASFASLGYGSVVVGGSGTLNVYSGTVLSGTKFAIKVLSSGTLNLVPEAKKSIKIATDSRNTPVSSDLASLIIADDSNAKVNINGQGSVSMKVISSQLFQYGILATSSNFSFTNGTIEANVCNSTYGSPKAFSFSPSITNVGTVVAGTTYANAVKVASPAGETYTSNSYVKVGVNYGSLFDAKFTSSQVRYVERSPLFPKANMVSRVYGFGTDVNEKGTMTTPSAGGYFKFELAYSKASEIPDTTLKNVIVNGLSTVSCCSSTSILDAVVVKKCIYNSEGTLEKTSSSYGFIWGISEEGFMYSFYDSYYDSDTGGLPLFRCSYVCSYGSHLASFAYVPTQSTPYTYDQIMKDDYYCMSGDSADALTGLTAAGTILDSSGDPISGLTVTVHYGNTDVATCVTDENGNFISDPIEPQYGHDPDLPRYHYFSFYITDGIHGKNYYSEVQFVEDVYYDKNFYVARTDTVFTYTYPTSTYETLTIPTHTVTYEVNNAEYGTVNKTSTVVKDGTEINQSMNWLYVGSDYVWATPTSASDGYKYFFRNWSGYTNPVTGDITITANFEKTIIITYNSSAVKGSTSYGYKSIGADFDVSSDNYLVNETYTQIGWSLVEANGTPVTVIDTDTTGVVLYPIYKMTNSITSSTTKVDLNSSYSEINPNVTTKYGTPVITYSTSENGVYTSTVPTSEGYYWVKVTVDETDEYTSVSEKFEFEVCRRFYLYLDYRDGYRTDMSSYVTIYEYVGSNITYGDVFPTLSDRGEGGNISFEGWYFNGAEVTSSTVITYFHDTIIQAKWSYSGSSHTAHDNHFSNSDDLVYVYEYVGGDWLSGDYIILSDILSANSSDVSIYGDSQVNLCLNGYKIDFGSDKLLTVTSESTLNIYDHSNGKITSSNVNETIAVYGTLSVYSGTFENTNLVEDEDDDGNAIYLCSGDLYIKGGAISAVGITIATESGHCYITGGTVSSSNSFAIAFNITVHGNIMDISGGIINGGLLSSGDSSDNHGAVYIHGDAVISGSLYGDAFFLEDVDVYIYENPVFTHGSVYVMQDENIYASYNGTNYTGSKITFTLYDDSFEVMDPLEEGIVLVKGVTSETVADKFAIVGSTSTIDLVYADSKLTIGKKQYKLTWDADGGELGGTYTSGRVCNGTTIVAPTPTKTGYTFTGWDTSVASTMPTNSLSYTATWVLTEYTYKFTDASNSDYKTQAGNYGAAITAPSNPTKTSDAQYDYTFDGWYTALTGGTKVTDFGTLSADVTYYARFNTTLRQYTVNFVDGSGNTLQTGVLDYGATPSYAGTTPTKAADIQYTYTFSGWDKEISSVTGDVTYTAAFSRTANKYSYTFYGEDGTVISTDSIDYGATITAPTTPTKSSTVQYNYTFDGWYTALTGGTKVTDLGTMTEAGASFYARFTQSVRQYSVTWKNDDGTVITTSNVDYGTTPSFTGSNPTKAETDQYIYTFAGWDKTIAAVTGDVTYTATYTYKVKVVSSTTTDNPGSSEASNTVGGEIVSDTGLDPNTSVIITVIPTEDTSTTLPEGDEYVQTYNISVLVDGVEQTVTDTITVKVEKPAGYIEGQTYQVIISNGQGGTEVVDTKVEGDYIVFETRFLGDFALIKQASTDGGFTPFMVAIISLLVLDAIEAALLIALVSSYKSLKKDGNPRTQVLHCIGILPSLLIFAEAMDVTLISIVSFLGALGFVLAVGIIVFLIKIRTEKLRLAKEVSNQKQEEIEKKNLDSSHDKSLEELIVDKNKLP